MNDSNETTTVMVVDDTPANLKLLEEMLGEQGYRVLAFPRGPLALRAAVQNPPDLFLLDVMMPDMDGFELCRRLKATETLRDIPVIFISALDDSANKVKAFAEGGVDYVTKPFQKDEVLARLRTHLGLRRQQLEIAAQQQQLQQSLEQLRQLESQRDTLVHMIVHDMRSPLLGIIGFTDLLHSSLKDEGLQELIEDVETIQTSARTLQRMISTLLDISRMESNELPLDRKACDLSGLVSAALTNLGGLVKQAKVFYRPATHGATAFCDAEVTRRIIENLVGNAIKFVGKNGEVNIRLEPTERGPKVIVSDTGPGIPPEYQGCIFDKFGPAAAAREGKKYSSGLGLAFCKLAVEAQGGQIGMESEVGKGSTFWFVLPAGA